MTPFKDLPDAERAEILRRFDEGLSLQRWDYTGRGTYEWSEPAAMDAISKHAAYRIPNEPPSFEHWHVLPDWVRYIARDEDGVAYAFEARPKIACSIWRKAKGMMLHVTDFPGYHPGTVPWNESLIERPEGV